HHAGRVAPYQAAAPPDIRAGAPVVRPGMDPARSSAWSKNARNPAVFLSRRLTLVVVGGALAVGPGSTTACRPQTIRSTAAFARAGAALAADPGGAVVTGNGPDRGRGGRPGGQPTRRPGRTGPPVRRGARDRHRASVARRSGSVAQPGSA